MQIKWLVPVWHNFLLTGNSVEIIDVHRQVLFLIHNLLFLFWSRRVNVGYSEIPIGKSLYDVETNHLIWISNQLVGFYMIQVFTERCFQIYYGCTNIGFVLFLLFTYIGRLFFCYIKTYLEKNLWDEYQAFKELY